MNRAPPPDAPRRAATRTRTGGFTEQVVVNDRHDSPPRLKESQESLLRSEIAKLRGEKAELERIQRVAHETRNVSYPPPVVLSTAPPPAKPAIAALPAPPEPVPPRAGPTWQQALIGLAVAMAALGAPMGVYLTASAAATAAEVERQKIKTAQVVKDAESASKDTKENDKELALMKAELQAFKSYFIEVQRLQGVTIRRPEGLPAAPVLDTSAPLQKPNRVTPGPSLTIQTPP